METLKMRIALVIALTVSFFVAGFFGFFFDTAFGEKGEVHQAPPPMFHKMGLSGITGDQDYLYVMAGGKLMVYKKNGKILQKTVNLPDPPACASPPKPELSQFPPPFPPPRGGGPHGLWSGSGVLYVLAGPMIYEYSTPDLSLVSSTELPKPELPKTGH